MESQLNSVTIDQVVFDYFLGNGVVYIERPFFGIMHVLGNSEFRLSEIRPRVFDTEQTHHAMQKLMLHIHNR